MSTENFIDSYSIYANRYSFMGRPLTRNPDDADVFVIGLPYDLGTSGRSGTRSGPGGIRSASANLRWEEKRWPWDFNVFERLRVADYGELEFPTGHHDALFEEVAAHYGRLLAAGKTTLSFGGEHFVTLPLLRARRCKVETWHRIAPAAPHGLSPRRRRARRRGALRSFLVAHAAGASAPLPASSSTLERLVHQQRCEGAQAAP